MRTLSSIVVWTGLLTAAATTPLAAQRPAAASAPAAESAHRLHWGPQLSFDFSGGDLGVGGVLDYSLASLLGSPRIAGRFEATWFPGTVNVFDLTYNVVYNFRSPTLRPYAGGGLSLLIANGGGANSTDLHLDAVGGLKFKPLGRVTPFVQLRYVFVHGDALIAGAGVLF